MKRTVIILTGDCASGKTTLAQILTHDGQSGGQTGIVIEDYDHNRITQVGFREIRQCYPRIVICCEAVTQELKEWIYELLADADVLIWRISRN